MRRLDKVKKLLLLAGWLIVATILYYLPGNFGFFYMPIIYLVIVTVAGVLYVLVNGGIRPIADDESERIRRHRSEESGGENGLLSDGSLRPNPLKLTDDKRIFWSDILLIIAVVPITIVLVDYLLISFHIL